MKMFRTALLATAASVAFAGAAYAADPIAPAPIPTIPVYDPGFDWSGFYAGASVGGLNNINASDTDWTLGVHAGFNGALDFFLVGLEVALDAVFDDPDTYAYGQILARGGVVVADPILIYGAVGLGTDFDATNGVGSHILAGGGLEFAVGNDVSIRGQYLYGWDQSNDLTSSDIHKFTIGASFHF